VTAVKALFGVVSLLVALVIVGLVLVKQMKAVGQLGAMSAIPASGNVHEKATPLERKVADDVAKAMEQAASSRNAEVEKP
jgi:preprotein translocase subunit SecG